MDFLDLARTRAAQKLLFLPHAIRQMSREERKLTAADVRQTIEAGRLIEEYPEDRRGHSGLILGKAVDGRPVHVVCVPKDEYLAVITAYVPSSESWLLNFTKRAKS